jgi:predicted protein tyrosine phosphatase
MYMIRDWLVIGKYAETKNKELLDGLGIHAMLQLASPVGYEDITTQYVMMEDGESLSREKLDTALDFIREQRAEGKRIMIACGAGISRSVVLSMAALMDQEGLPLFEAYRVIHEKHNAARPHHDMVLSLAGYAGLELDLLDVWDGLNNIQRGDAASA